MSYYIDQLKDVIYSLAKENVIRISTERLNILLTEKLGIMKPNTLKNTVKLLESLNLIKQAEMMGVWEIIYKKK